MTHAVRLNIHSRVNFHPLHGLAAKAAVCSPSENHFPITPHSCRTRSVRVCSYVVTSCRGFNRIIQTSNTEFTWPIFYSLQIMIVSNLRKMWKWTLCDATLKCHSSPRLGTPFFSRCLFQPLRSPYLSHLVPLSDASLLKVQQKCVFSGRLKPLRALFSVAAKLFSKFLIFLNPNI